MTKSRGIGRGRPKRRVSDPDWLYLDDLPCAGQTEKFFVKGFFPYEAISICKRCGWKEECLELALVNRETFGVWGGKTARQRVYIASQRRKSIERPTGS